MNTDERCLALQGLGYTPRQAAFLTVVALHGGYFLRRQYVAFLGQPDGGLVTALLKKVLVVGHATRLTADRHTHIYHLSTRPVYNAVGIPDSGDRSPASPTTIARRLMRLDIVLQWRDRLVLATEPEKVRFFTEAWALDHDRLPAKTAPPDRAGRPSIMRYFTDKAPIAATPGTAAITFAYVPGLVVGMSGFRTFLADYRRLLFCLPEATILYCTTHPEHVPAARRVWAQAFGVRLPPTPPRPDAMVLRAHFHLRRDCETTSAAALAPAARAQLQRDLERFAAPSLEALYRRWRTAGDVVLDEYRRTVPPPPAGPAPRFDGLHLRHHYPRLPRAPNGGDALWLASRSAA